MTVIPVRTEKSERKINACHKRLCDKKNYNDHVYVNTNKYKLRNFV